MNNTLVYKILYYVCFVFSLCIMIALTTINGVLYLNFATNLQMFVILLNIILVVIFSVMLHKKKLSNANILFPINYLVFSILVIFICFLMNDKLIHPYMQFGYYISFILFSYLLLNIYSLLCFTKKK